MTSETWRQVQGFRGLYEVSDLGNVRSVDRTTPDGRFIKGRLLKQWEAHGYAYVSLSKDAKKHGRRVHRLVAEAFVPNPEAKETVNHKDGQRKNNCVSNLEWVTQSENNAHMFSILHPDGIGWKRPGPRPWRRKVSAGDADAIRTDTRTQREIALEYGISESTVGNIKKGTYY